MGLDIRMPIGLLFSIIGAILVAYGAVGDRSLYTRSLGMNVNLGWGAVLLLFGAIMLFLGRRGTSAQKVAARSPAGRETEEREHRQGLERERGD